MTAKRVTISFDNGPTPGVTDEVLRILADHHVLASFFVVGENLLDPAARACMQRAAEQGHWIGNHTMTHSVLFGATGEDGLAELEIGAAQREIGEFVHPDRLFRPYAAGGILDQSVFSPEVLAYLQHHEYTCVLWNNVPHDWDEPDIWVQTALDTIEEQDWSLVVVHDLDTGAMAHLPAFISRLADDDIEIVQDFPSGCVPMRRGHLRQPLDHLMPDGGASGR